MTPFQYFTLVVFIVLLMGVIMALIAYDWGVQQGRLEERRWQREHQRYIRAKSPARGTE